MIKFLISLPERLFSPRIWARRINNLKLASMDRIAQLTLLTQRPYTVAIIGDYKHFLGSKLARARFWKLTKGIKVQFEPYDRNKTYDRIVKWEPFKRVDHPKNIINIINGEMANINKRAIDKLHKQIFGTSLLIDPTTYEGSFLEKDAGTHDGAGHSENQSTYNIHNKNLSLIDPTKVYARLIDNSNDQGQFVDFRFYVVNKDLFPFYCKFILEKRFESRASDSSENSIRTLSTDFSTLEIQNIKAFIPHLNLDYGEIDVIRDRKTKNIYLIDINNTPYGDFRRIGFDTSQIREIYKSVLID